MDDSIFNTYKKFNDTMASDAEVDLVTSAIHMDSTYGNNIYKLFDGLLELFKTLNLISEDPKENASKFRFIHAFPDMIKDDGSNVLTYNIIKRNPRQTQNYSINTRSVTKSKATHVAEKYNEITGNVDDFYKLEFDNIVSITVFSKKARTLNNITRIIEAIMLKYSSYIKQFVDEVVYLGMSDIRFLDRYEEQAPIYARELQFKVLTTEVFKQELEQAKSIDIQLK